MVDQPPSNDYQKMISKLKTVYEWNQVAKIRLAKTETENFISTLHAVNPQQLKVILNTPKLPEDQDTQKVQPLDKPLRPVLPELEGLMEDSVISMANLSDFETPKELSLHSETELGSNRELEILKEFEEYKAAKAPELKQE